MYTFIFFPGNDSVWHGFIDIVFMSPYPMNENEDVPAIAKAVEEEEEGEEIIESLDEQNGKCGFFKGRNLFVYVFRLSSTNGIMVLYMICSETCNSIYSQESQFQMVATLTVKFRIYKKIMHIIHENIVELPFRF